MLFRIVWVLTLLVYFLKKVYYAEIMALHYIDKPNIGGKRISLWNTCIELWKDFYGTLDDWFDNFTYPCPRYICSCDRYTAENKGIQWDQLKMSEDCEIDPKGHIATMLVRLNLVCSRLPWPHIFILFYNHTENDDHKEAHIWPWRP